MRKKSLIIAVFLAFSGLAGAVKAGPVDECIRGKGDDSQIAACSRVIQSQSRSGASVNIKNLAEIYVYRGIAHGNRNDYNKALADFSKAIELAPKLAMAWAHRGAFHNTNSRYELAVKDFKQATRLDPSLDSGFAGLGFAWFRLGYEDRAIAAYTKAIRLSPENANYYYARAGVYMEEIYAEGTIPPQRKKRLLFDLRKVLKLNPRHEGARADLKTLSAK